MYPRLHLALDNCFASKRWTEPIEWMTIAAEAGVYCIEASADNECDPLYSTPDTLRDWINNIHAASDKTGVKVVNLYSGHGTYATLGLTHPDQRVRDHIQHDWLEPMIRNAAALNAGLGFFCHAFAQVVLAEPERYAAAEADLYTRLAELSRFAAESGLASLSLEQMYSPHQIPWTISGTQRLMHEVYRRGNSPLYITLDTGHQIGQRRHLKPDRAQIEAYVAAVRNGQTPSDVWLGPLPIHVDEPNAVDRLIADLERKPYLFATEPDGDLYNWLRALGCYAPIIHLQQTDGTASAHRPFTAQYNQRGIVSGEKVLAALFESYNQAEIAEYPPRCQDIYLTIEMFSGTAEHPAQILSNIRETAAYWRQYIPQDGMTLDRLVEQHVKM